MENNCSFKLKNLVNVVMKFWFVLHVLFLYQNLIFNSLNPKELLPSLDVSCLYVNFYTFDISYKTIVPIFTKLDWEGPWLIPFKILSDRPANLKYDHY